MKNKVIVIMFLIMLFCVNILESFAAYECVVHRKTKENEMGFLDWKDELPGCKDAGVNCIIESCNETKIGQIELSENGNFILSLNLEFVDLKRKIEGPNGEEWISIRRNGSNYIFTHLDYIEITECAEYPSLVGKVIELEGIGTDSFGNYFVAIPNN